jgi:hypothetical protein
MATAKQPTVDPEAEAKAEADAKAKADAEAQAKLKVESDAAAKKLADALADKAKADGARAVKDAASFSFDQLDPKKKYTAHWPDKVVTVVKHDRLSGAKTIIPNAVHVVINGREYLEHDLPGVTFTEVKEDTK